MADIMDYIDWRGDIGFDEVHVNEVDGLIFYPPNSPGQEMFDVIEAMGANGTKIIYAGCKEIIPYDKTAFKPLLRGPQ